jgi:hypothetical protein
MTRRPGKFSDGDFDPVYRLEGDDIPVSKFLENNLMSGTMIMGTTKHEKRKPNPSLLQDTRVGAQ